MNRKNILFFLYFLAGLSALSLEICWQRLLGITFGSTTLASAIIIANFMAGMAGGSFLISRFFPPGKISYLSALAGIEITLGIYSFLIPYILKSGNFIYLKLTYQFLDNFYLLSLGRFFLSFFLIGPPTLLMGAAFPLISELLIRENSLGKDFGLIYSCNTMGGMIGCFLSGFFLIRYLGVQGTNMLGAGLNLLIGIILFALIFLPPGEEKKEIEKMNDLSGKNNQKNPRHLSLILPLSFFCFGFLSLALEIIFTRILIFFVYNHTYSFTIILTSFLGGILLGTILAGRLSGRIFKEKLFLLLGVIQILLGSGLAILFRLINKLSFSVNSFDSSTWKGFFLARYSPAILLLFPPALLMGLSLPLAAVLYMKNRNQIYRGIGELYALNTTGGVLGVFMSGFLLIPFLGLKNSLLFIALIYLLLGQILVLFQPALKTRDKILTFSCSGSFAIFIFLQIFSLPVPLILSAGVFDPAPRENKVLFYKEGIESAVSVIEDLSGVRKIYVDAHQAANDSRWDAPSHKIIAHLPLFLHPNPKKALVIGFGMGLTSQAIILNKVAVDAVEISKGVIEANSFFFRVNRRILSHPLFKLTIGDGRNFVRITPRKYDFISVGIIHPLINSGSAGFYSREFYEECKRILNENGIISQWVPLHSVPPESFKLIIRTFLNSFPHSSLWYKFTSDFILLIATPERLNIDYQAFAARMKKPGVFFDLKDVDMESPPALLDSFFLDANGLKKYAGEGPLHTDNRPYLEFFTPREKTNSAYYNLRSLQPLRRSVLPFLSNLGKTEEEKRQIIVKIKKAFKATQYTIQGQLRYLKKDFRGAINKFQIGLSINPWDNNLRFIRDELAYNIKLERRKNKGRKQFAE